MIRLPRRLAEQLISHARDAAPDEACGVVGLRGDAVERYVPARNASTRPQVHFTFDDSGYLSIIKLEKEGLEPGIYHSHPASPAYPSATDRREMSATWPESLQLMVSVRNDATTGPELFAYRIDSHGNVREEPLQITD